MTKLLYSDLEEGTIFFEQRKGKNCEMKVVMAPVNSINMVAGIKRTQWRWQAVDANEDTPKKVNYLVTEGYEEHAPELFSTRESLPEEVERKSITITLDDLFNTKDDTND